MIENIFLEGPAGEELPSFRNNHFARPLAAVVGASSGQTQVNLLVGCSGLPNYLQGPVSEVWSIAIHF